MGRVRRVHFVGIGGAGMSGIAEVLHNLGYEVVGSDAHEGPVLRHLRKLGIKVHVGHDASQIAGADVVVASTAVPVDNPELEAARAARVPIIPRADMLAEIMRFRYGIAIAGTHGKTTTTSLTASLLAEGGLDPTFVIGGRLTSAGTHARLGAGRYIVVEADESDASFLRLNPVMAIVTNIDADHLGTYGGDTERLHQAFVDFVQRLPFYGLAVLCRDDPGVERILPALTKPHRTYGEHPDADVRIRAIRQHAGMTEFEVSAGSDAPWLPLRVNMPGRHQALNAAAAITVARELGVSDDAIRTALAGFGGVGRRFQIYADVRIGVSTVLLVDDYGHHPTEIAVTLAAARTGWPGRRVVLAFQPHRYSRTRDLFEDFVSVLGSADVLLLLDVYAAGEEPIQGADGRSLARAIRLRGAVEPIFAATPSELTAILPGVVRDEDLLLIVGAGSIGTIAAQLAAASRPRRRSRPSTRVRTRA